MLSAHGLRELAQVRSVEFSDVRRVRLRHLGSEGLEDKASSTAVRERLAKAGEGQAQLVRHREHLDHVA